MLIEYKMVSLTSGKNCLKQVNLIEIDKEDIVDGSITIKIPATIDGQSVDIIGFPSNMSDNSYLLYTTKEIKRKLTSIKYEIEEGPTKLQGMCSSIPVVFDMPNSIEEILPYCFKETSLTLTFKEGSRLKKIHEGAFYESLFTEEFHLPELCTHIPKLAFARATFSNGFFFNKTLLEIEDKAFYLTNFQTEDDLFFPNTLKTIGEEAFGRAEGINSINITKKSNIAQIGASAFEEATINKVTITAHQREIILGECCFKKCTHLKKVNLLKANIQKISKECFSICYNIEDIQLPNQLQIISEDAFKNAGIEKIYLPDNLKAIDIGAFRCCGLKEITKSSSNKNIVFIGNEAFSHNNLVSMPEDILENVRLCGNNIFVNNDFETLTIYPPENTEILGKSLFSTNNHLKNVELKNNNYNWTKIPDRLFYKCKNLENISIPDTVEELSELCLSETSIAEISLSSIKILKPSVFLSCKKLVNVDLSACPLKKIGNFAFANTHNLKKVLLPVYFTNIKATTFDGRTEPEIENILKSAPFVKIY